MRRQLDCLHEALVEKDWLVVKALAAITAADKGPFQLVFQGGTALSRAHRVIERMSEDIDIKIVSEGPPSRPSAAAPARKHHGRAYQGRIQIRSQKSQPSKIQLRKPLHAVSAALRADSGGAGGLAAGNPDRNLRVAGATAAG